jgi:DNA-binding response OmpR family regulator
MPYQRSSITTILAVDPDSKVREVVSQVLTQEGHRVIEADSAQVALELAREHRPDIVILDVMLPDMSGFDLCSYLRTMPYVDHTSILFLSAYQGAQYAARALDCGGDDYLRKPFVVRELNARVRALLRRSSSKQSGLPTVLHIDAERRCVGVNSRMVPLTPTEFQLLDHLCRHQDQYHTAPGLLQALWQYPLGSGDTALVRNHIRNLRRKIEADPNHPTVITSLHGRGYAVNARVVYC